MPEASRPAPGLPSTRMMNLPTEPKREQKAPPKPRARPVSLYLFADLVPFQHGFDKLSFCDKLEADLPLTGGEQCPEKSTSLT
jgi:hypothetical protein